MLSIIHARTDNGLEGILRVVTTLRRKTFDIVDLGMTTEKEDACLRIVIKEHPEKNAQMALAYLNQIYELRDVSLVGHESTH